MHAATEHRLLQLALLLLGRLLQDVVPAAALVAEADDVLEEIEIEELLGSGEEIPLAARAVRVGCSPCSSTRGGAWSAPLLHGAR